MSRTLDGEVRRHSAVYLTAQTYRDVDEIALENGITRSAAINMLLRRGIQTIDRVRLDQAEGRTHDVAANRRISGVVLESHRPVREP